MNIHKLFSRPGIVAVIADVNQGKSMFLYHLIEEARKSYSFDLFYYGLRADLKGHRIYSVAEMESVRNAVIIVDEFCSLFDLENRKSKRAIENTLRLIHHNNNVLILAGVPENFKKFISAKLTEIFFKKVTFSDCINGSTVKNILMSFNGQQKGSEILNLKIDEVLHYNGTGFEFENVPYYSKYDTKRNNPKILERLEK